MAVTAEALEQDDGSFNALQELQEELAKVTTKTCVEYKDSNWVVIASTYRIPHYLKIKRIQSLET